MTTRFRNWQIFLNEGFREQQSGNYVAAENAFRTALQLNPNQQEAVYHLARLLIQNCRIDEALILLNGATKAHPKDAFLRATLGEIYHTLARYQDALKEYREALRLKPDLAATHGNIGAVLQKLGNEKAAFISYKRALNLAPPNYLQLVSMGDICCKLGRRDEAVHYYSQAIDLQPIQSLAYANMANMYAHEQEWASAEPFLRHALALEPSRAEFHNCLGILLHAIGRNLEAISAYEQAIRLKPEAGYYYSNRSNAFQALGDFDSAVSDLTVAITYHPEDIVLRNDLASILLGLGQLEKAEGILQEALVCAPEHPQTNRSLLMTALYKPDNDLAMLFKMHTEYGRSQNSKPSHTFLNRCVKRPLRIGYVSSDLRRHPVARNLRPLIEFRDRKQFEVFIYSAVKSPDMNTQWFEAEVDGWRSIVDISDEAVAHTIRKDKIDILVFLASHFDDNRPLVAIFRAAPIQVSMHDPVTSGLDEMDYLVADSYLVPRDTRERFTENIIRLPFFYVHGPFVDMPQVTVLPARSRGHVTFGSFNNPAKLNEQVVAVWSSILNKVPHSKLLLKYRAMFSIPSVRARYLGLFARFGINAERLLFVGDEVETIPRHMEWYAGVDISLDPFPFSGSTTTFESLWMGVPVITRRGDRMVARWSGAMLSKLGLDNLIANDENEYVDTAQRLASNLDYLEDLRKSLRDQVTQSKLCAERQRAKQIERVFRWMWAKWCHDGQN